MKDNITILCKPTHECNMNCKYCYDKKEKKLVKNKTMTFEILEKSIRIILEDFKNITWIWHGGEATLMGKDFFEKAMNIFDKYKTEKHNINFLMQSNGKNIKETKEWLKKLNINVGYSYDLTNDNKYREKINLLEHLDDEDGIISVVSENDYDLIKYFEKYKNRSSLCFNKIFFNNKEQTYNVKMISNAYKNLFDFILYDKECNVEKNIYNFIKMILNKNDLQCNFKQCIGEFISINPDGYLFSCDRFGMEDEKYCLGNVNDYEHILECFSSEGFYNIIKDDFKFRKENCEKCNINMFCKNICKANRVDQNSKIDISKNCLDECEFRREITNYIFEKLFNLKRDDLLKINKNIYNLLFENKFIFKFILDELKESINVEF